MCDIITMNVAGISNKIPALDLFLRHRYDSVYKLERDICPVSDSVSNRYRRFLRTAGGGTKIELPLLLGLCEARWNPDWALPRLPFYSCLSFPSGTGGTLGLSVFYR